VALRLAEASLDLLAQQRLLVGREEVPGEEAA